MFKGAKKLAISHASNVSSERGSGESDDPFAPPRGPPLLPIYVRLDEGEYTGPFRIEINGIVDTGSERTIITTKLADNILGPNWRKHMRDTSIVLRSASEDILPIIGYIKMHITADVALLKHPVVVMESEANDFILGNDLMTETITINDSTTVTIKLPDGSRTKPLILHYKMPTIIVRALSDILIEGRSNNSIIAALATQDGGKFDWECATNKDLIVSNPIDEEGEEKNQVSDISCISPVRRGKRILLTLQNHSDEPLEMKRGDVLGIGEFLCASDATLYKPTGNCSFIHERETLENISKGSKEGEIPLPPPLVPDPPLKEGKRNDFDKYDNKFLTPKQKKQLIELLKKNKNIFSASDLDPGKTEWMTHKIDTGDHPPVFERYRPTPFKYQEEVQLQLDAMLKEGIIEPAHKSGWASNLVYARKPNGKLRICNDLRKVNALVQNRSRWPIHHIDESYAKLSGSKVRTILDFSNAYYAIPLADEASRDRTSFHANGRLYRFIRTPFGETSIPQAFNRLMSMIVDGCETFSFTFFDDLTVFSQTWDEHFEHLTKIFERIQLAGLKLRYDKCQFGMPASTPLPWLGSIVVNDELHVNPKRVESVQAITPPKTVKQVQRFLGAASYLRKHVNHFSTMAAPLYDLTCATNIDPFKWEEKHQKSFEMLKKALVTPPVLALPDFKQKFVITTDASDLGIGVCFSQIAEDGVERLIAYASRRLTLNERLHYSTPEKELCGITYGLVTFYFYIANNKFILRTDSKALTFCAVFQNCNTRIYKVSALLAELDFEIQHQSATAGAVMSICDYLSRPTDDKKPPLTTYKDLRHPSLSKINGPPNIKNKQKITKNEFAKINTEYMGTLIPHLQEEGVNLLAPSCYTEYVGLISLTKNDFRGNLEQCSTPHYSQMTGGNKSLSLDQSKEGRVLLATLTDSMLNVESFANLQKHDNFCKIWLDKIGTGKKSGAFRLTKGVLMRETQLKDGTVVSVIVVPRVMTKTILTHFHGSYATAHCGVGKLLHMLRQRFYWPSLTDDAVKYVKTCPLCLYQKPSPSPQAFGKTKSPTRPNEIISIDIVGPLTRSAEGYTYIVTMIDEFTKFAMAIPLRSKATEGVAKAVTTHWVTVLGQPGSIHSDMGGDTDSPLIQELCQILNIKKSRTPGYSPWANGGIERWHRTLQASLKIAMTNSNPKYWAQQLPFLTMTYNSLPHDSTKMSPNYILFGHNNITNHIVPVIPIDHPIFSQNEHLKAIRTAQQISWAIVKRNLASKKGARIKKSHQNTTGDLTFKLGQFILVRKFAFAGAGGKKLDKTYIGPYRIIRKYPKMLAVVHYTSE
jgi:transposase InsO family protein